MIEQALIDALANHPEKDAILAILIEEDSNPELRQGYAISVADPQEWSASTSPSPCEVLIHAEERGEVLTLPADSQPNYNVSLLAHWRADLEQEEGAAKNEYKGDRYRDGGSMTKLDRFDPEGFERHAKKQARRIARFGIEFCFDDKGRNVSDKKAAAQHDDTVASAKLARKLADATAKIIAREVKREATRAKRIARIVG